MVDYANAAQRQASAAINSGEDFSHKSIQAIDNYDNFDQTIMVCESETCQSFGLSLPSPRYFHLLPSI